MAFFDDNLNEEGKRTPVSYKALSRLGFRDSGTIAPIFTYAVENRKVKTSWGGPTYTTAIYFRYEKMVFDYDRCEYICDEASARYLTIENGKQVMKNFDNPSVEDLELMILAAKNDF
jgi:hypothetical protein